VLLYKLRSGADAAEVRHPGAARLVEEATGGGIPEAGVGTIARNGTVEAAAVEHLLVRELVNRGYLELQLESSAGERIASLLPTGAGFEMSAPPADDGAFLLSRFTYLRGAEHQKDSWVLENPRVAARVELGPPGFAALGELRAAKGPVVGAAGELGALLFRAGFMQPAAASIDATADHAIWEFHDLLFHVASRRGRHDRPFGATYHLRDRMPAPPAVRPARDGDPIRLPLPDLAAATAHDPPFARVAEARRSIREYGAGPPTAEQVGELLFRVARVKAVLREADDEITSRPYPSAGARYPLEIYLAIDGCRGLPPGMHHYDPVAHALIPVTGEAGAREQLVRDATVGSRPPPIVMILAARVARTSWKYQSIAYALVLKDAGVLMATVCLTATAIGLAACCVGTGDSEAFARATGVDPLQEPAVGEIALGPLPDSR
jgi:SagB-type dehydrogenase family enzyme